MRLDARQTEKLLLYSGRIFIKSFGIGMVVRRLKGQYRVDPSPVTVERAAAELNGIFERHADIAEDDYRWMASL
jgi:hypothetical protein